MLYLTCTTITVGLAHYGVSRAKDWVSGACGTKYNVLIASLLSNFIAERGTRTETFLWRDLSLFFFFFFFFFSKYFVSSFMPVRKAHHPTNMYQYHF